MQQGSCGICHQLDGIPLAIELAATRTKSCSLKKIYERLNDRFRLLTGGKRYSIAKTADIESDDWLELWTSVWKWKILLRRLSVFPGGFTLKMLKKSADDNIPENDILDLVYGLTEKSIVIYQEEKDRYKMLETIRQYGEEKLRESDESKTLHLKHLNYYLKISEKSWTWAHRSEKLKSGLKDLITNIRIFRRLFFFCSWKIFWRRN